MKLDKIQGLFGAFGLALLLVACQPIASIHQPTASKSQAGQRVQCPSPRPQMCTRQYDPVCAVTSDGLRSTQGNACSACSNAAIVAYIAGECVSAD
ncbi:MAG: hypothetical protein CL693_17240 [Cellvibrionaceae bacterium]|nr:hypothetical protein [Cellvibrionaceae bacterium]